MHWPAETQFQSLNPQYPFGLWNFAHAHSWGKGAGLWGAEIINKKQLSESNSRPWNIEVTDVYDTESPALSASLDKPHPFVFKLFSLQSCYVLK